MLRREYGCYDYAILGVIIVGKGIGRTTALYGLRNYERCLCHMVLQMASFGYLLTMF